MDLNIFNYLNIIFVCVEYWQIGYQLLVPKREKLGIYKNLSAKFKPFRLKPQTFLPNLHFTRCVLTYKIYLKANAGNANSS